MLIVVVVVVVMLVFTAMAESGLISLLVNVVTVTVPVVGVHVHVAIVLGGVDAVLIAGILGALVFTLILHGRAGVPVVAAADSANAVVSLLIALLINR